MGDYKRYGKSGGPKGFTVLGIPSNQFNQEREEEADIKTYCAITWGVTFPMSKKMVLQGEGQHPLYQALTRIPFANGETGPVRWNFEKFLLLPEGDVLRFPHDMNPDSEEIVSLIQRKV